MPLIPRRLSLTRTNVVDALASVEVVDVVVPEVDDADAEDEAVSLTALAVLTTDLDLTLLLLIPARAAPLTSLVSSVAGLATPSSATFVSKPSVSRTARTC